MTHRMSTHELLELASLDAMGLLSEEERAAFDAAFKAAPPAVQAQLRAEQARMAGDDSLLPPVQPPVGLRARVVAAVRDAIGASRTVAGRIAPDILPGRGVTPIWRAAAIGCLAASIVFALTTLHMMRTFESIAEHRASDAWTEQWVSDFGPRFERLLLDPKVPKVAFTPSSEDETVSRAGAVVLLDPETGMGEFLCKNLPETDGEYQLVVVDKEGNRVGDPVLTFRPTGARFHRSIQREADPDLEMAVIAFDRGESDARTLLRASQSL